MPQNRGQQGERPMERQHGEQVQQSQPQAQLGSPQDAHRLRDYEKVGPISIEGVEASDLPDKGRGDVYTNPGKEGKRNLPQNTGETVGPGASHQTGLRGDPDVADAAKSGGRKHN